MSFKAKFNNTQYINKPFYQVVLEGVYLGNILNLKIKNYPLILTIKNIFKYTFSKQVITTLKETEIRIIDNYTIIGSKIVQYYQLQIPYMANASYVDQEKYFAAYTLLLENLQNFQSIDIFYYDRPEVISDYSNYLKQLDNKMSKNNNYTNQSGRELAQNLRQNMEGNLQEIFDSYCTRSREAFLILSDDLTGHKLVDIDASKKSLDLMKDKLLLPLQAMGINFKHLDKEHRDWLLTNFISNTTNY
jgi:hypothetical protein